MLITGSRSTPRPRPGLAALFLLVACAPAASQSPPASPSAPGSARAPSAPSDAFSGSFRLTSGEVITGGLFVEDGRDFLLFMDVDHLAKGGLFEQTGDYTFRSIIPPGLVELEFEEPGRRGSGGVDRVTWKQEGSPPISGTRVFPHSTFPVAFRSADGTELAGDLLVPQCAGPHPLVVGGHGSGAVNRYAGMYTTYFLQQGMAVLRFDKRGYTTDLKEHAEPDLRALAEDVAAAARFAAARPEVDADRIGVFGTSQGGWVAPVAAAGTPEVRYLIIRAGPGVNDSETYLHERRAELRDEGMTGTDLDRAMALQAEIQALAMDGADISETDRLVQPYLETDWYRTAFGEGPISGRWSARWWGWMQRNFALTPGPSIERFGGPILWFLAEEDQNVPLIASRAALERSFAAAPGDDHELVVIAGANHGFLVQPPGEPPRFTDGFFGRLGEWLGQRGLDDASCWAGGVEG